jgi:branched-chain amino acid aminotransferase
MATAAPTKTWTYFEGQWHEGDVRIMGARTHGAWLGSTVFDGARRFEGVMPDLDLHLARVNQSAIALGLKPKVALQTWLDLVHAGISRFDAAAALYIRPMYWAVDGAAGGGVRFDPESTDWCLSIYEAPMPKAGGFSFTLSPFRRPTAECMPVNAKAGCLYPNNSRALFEAYQRGFDNCVLRDALGNVAELANANIMIGRDGVVYTPAPNGTFLNGITRQRVIALLRADGVDVVEKTMQWDEIEAADEVFSVGNFAKVAAANRIDQRELQPGPLFTRAKQLYWDYAHANGQAKSPAKAA